MKFLEDIFENTTDAVFGTDKHMRIRYWNRYCEELFQTDKSDALGRPCYELICGSDLLGNGFCRPDCKVAKHHDKDSPNCNWDLVIRRGDGVQAVVNVGSYYTNNIDEADDTEVRVYHSMRPINSHLLIRRLLINTTPTSDESSKINRLSKREYEILRMISSGIKTKTIAEQLVISQTTVRNHTKNIYAKLGVHSQAEAINYAVRHGLL